MNEHRERCIECNSNMFFYCFQSQQFHNKLNEILDMISQSNENLTSVTMVQEQKQRRPEESNSTNVFEMQYPDLFVYWDWRQYQSAISNSVSTAN
jgi:precorrin-3B methylase